MYQDLQHPVNVSSSISRMQSITSLLLLLLVSPFQRIAVNLRDRSDRSRLRYQEYKEHILEKKHLWNRMPRDECIGNPQKQRKRKSTIFESPEPIGYFLTRT